MHRLEISSKASALKKSQTDVIRKPPFHYRERVKTIRPLLVRCNALYQIKSHDPQLERFTVNSFDFRFCNITCQVGNFRVSLGSRPNGHLIPIGQGVDYWGNESHLLPTL